ncbi:hypothetical protein CW708_01905 [Candidatus Bathyarchaeota archaeon]|nr:MAG: hypothetical protein CW708_01905 [Candidatus Bathyarchaeota archaeon]
MKALENIKEIFKSLKHRKPTKIYCPRCGSPNIHLSSKFDYWLTPKTYVCEDCGYKGPIVMELEEEDDSKDEEG